uniref:Uncharacterized protein n=1 Tax=Salix viminalis TaxID=40686 RepID=A0A6N2LK15_SALVM
MPSIPCVFMPLHFHLDIQILKHNDHVSNHLQHSQDHFQLEYGNGELSMFQRILELDRDGNHCCSRGQGCLREGH